MQIICHPEFDWRIISYYIYDTHKLLAVYLGIRPWKKIVGKKRIIITLLNIDDVTLFDIHSLLFLKDIENLQKKLGNEKPRIALNLLLMTNFVWSFAIDFMPEETKW